MNNQALPLKLAVLGLDGVSWPLVETLTRQGVMPNLGRICDRSICGPMLSTLPEISPVAWTSFFTGQSPAKHGIFGFTDFEEESYRVRFNSSSHIRTPAVWDWLGMKNRPSIILNVPNTYPAKPLTGAMVSGFLSFDIKKASFPSWVGDYLETSGYKLEADFDVVHQDRGAFLTDLDNLLEGRAALLEKFWPEKWDLFFYALTDTDRLNHFFYSEYEEIGPIFDYFVDYYGRLDHLIGRFYELVEAKAKAGENVCLIMLSDHGFCGVKKEFHLNRWLNQNGFQDEVGPKAKLLALDPTRLYFNKQARFQAGTVSDADAGVISQKLQGMLLAEEAVDRLYLKSELYPDDETGLAPDFVIKPKKGFEFKAKFNPGPVYSDSPLKGTHTYEDAFYLIRDFSGLLPKPEVTDIKDLGKFMFNLLGL